MEAQMSNLAHKVNGISNAQFSPFAKPLLAVMALFCLRFVN